MNRYDKYAASRRLMGAVVGLVIILTNKVMVNGVHRTVVNLIMVGSVNEREVIIKVEETMAKIVPKAFRVLVMGGGMMVDVFYKVYK